jgi:hypothetical protein
MLPSYDQITTRYLIIGLPRSGTTLTHTGVLGHPNISALTDEMLAMPFFPKGLSAFTFGNEYPEEKQKGHRALFDAMTSILANDKTTALGAKCCPQTIEQTQALVQSVQKNFPDLKIILSIRDDLVAQYGSLVSARFDGVWHSWHQGADKIKNRRRRLYRPMFDRYVLNALESISLLRQLKQTHPVHEFAYEEQLTDQAGVFRRIFEFLRVPPVEVTWLRTKKVKDAPDQYITNYARMTRRLQWLRQRHETNTLPRRVRAGVRAIDSGSRFIYRHILRQE